MSVASRPIERAAGPGPRAAGWFALARRPDAALVPLGAAVLLAGSGGALWAGYALVALGTAARGRAAGDWLARRSPVEVGWALLLMGSLLGLVVSPNGSAALARLAAVVAAVSLLLWVRERAGSEVGLRVTAWALVAACALGALIVLALINGQLPDNQITRRLSPVLRLFGVFPMIGGDVLEVNSRFPVHQYGLAYLLLVMIPFLAAEAALGRGGRGRWAALAGAVFLVVLLAATEARGALLAAAVAVALVAGLRSRWFWMLLPLGGLAVYLLLARGIISRSIEADWLNTRLSIWTRSLSMLADYPFTGAGLGMRTFAEVFAWTYRLPNPYQVVHSHNILIQAYAEQGLLGLIGLLLALGAALFLAWRAARGVPAGLRATTAGVLGALVGTLLYGLTDQVPTTNDGLAIVAALCALAMAGAGFAPPASAETLVAARSNPASAGAPGAGLDRLRAGVLRRPGLLVLGVAIGLLIPLTPRWVSGLALNGGAAQAAGVALEPSMPVERKAASLASAEAWLVAASSWNRQNAGALRVLARARLLRHDVPGALAALEAAVATGNLNDYERTQLGQLYYEVGFWQQAFDLWRAAEQVGLLRQAADELGSKGDSKAAAAAYAALVELQPDQPEHYSNLAKAILAGPTPSVDEAMGWFEQATELNPRARRGLATQLVLEGEPYRINERRGGGRYELALFWFGLAARVDPTYDKPLVELGSAQYRTGLAAAEAGRADEARARFEEAARQFRAAVALDPKNSSSWHQLGQAEEAAGRLPDAVAAFEQAVQTGPGRGSVHASLGRIYARVGRCADARRELATALALPDENGSLARAEAERASLGDCR